ncbi:hypothetical protein EZV62_022333 [Acer yangbiense]|uniref:Receptor-like serine/threonine-protein kinase n=1 Tax=Acer yangbiense TaxID=1000413 RepID=A0A5C7H8C1_9ROSI|nr:hypothetical protein EZV62_022333 [Acer yangbiense]
MTLRSSLPSLLVVLLLFAVSSADDIPFGSTLFASNLSQSWSSPNKTFSLSFVQETPTSFVAAITYSGGVVHIWDARGASGSRPVDSGSTLQFLSTGILRLVNGSGAVVWESPTENLNVSSASLDDFGNLALFRGNVSVWSSFENPTDTIVPSQDFALGKVLRSGSYYFRLRKSGNLTLLWNDSMVYWNEGLNSSIDSNLTSPVLKLQSIGILSISDTTLSSAAIVAYSSDYAEGSDILRFLKLESDGNLRIRSSSRGSGTVTPRWSAVTDQCQVFGYCGNMGICSYNDSNSDPFCGCPSLNFELVDASDSRKGCKRKVEIADCPGSGTMLELEHTKFLTFEPELTSQVFFVGISACRLNCLVTDSCVASTSLSDGTGLCYLKTPEFVSGYQSPALPSTSYVKVCGPVLPNPSSRQLVVKNRSWKLHAWIIIVVVLSTLLVLVALEGGLWYWCCRNSPKFGSLSAQYALLEYASGAPVQFSYKELQRSTKGFKEKLGAGGFGAVYRGILANKTVVAVKQLEGIEQGEKQFRMEVATISSTHHLNLVRLIGFCSEGRHRLLVYEFMKNGSLDNFLFVTEEQSGKLLNWEYRFNIALETNRKKFSSWAYEEFEKGNIEGILDKRLAGQDVNMEQVTRAIQVSFWCIQEQPSQRPMMGKVVQMLEGIMEIERPPAPKTLTEGSVGGTSINVSSNVSALSTFAASAPAPSSSSSNQAGVSPLVSVSGRNTERTSSSLLGSSDQI